MDKCLSIPSIHPSINLHTKPHTPANKIRKKLDNSSRKKTQNAPNN